MMVHKPVSAVGDPSTPSAGRPKATADFPLFRVIGHILDEWVLGYSTDIVGCASLDDRLPEGYFTLLKGGQRLLLRTVSGISKWSPSFPTAFLTVNSGHRPRLRARFLRWARRRCSLRVIGAVACGASLWLPIAAYHEALHAGSTEPAALTLRYPLLIRDAVDEPL